jgi:hypothetical protein
LINFWFYFHHYYYFLVVIVVYINLFIALISCFHLLIFTFSRLPYFLYLEIQSLFFYNIALILMLILTFMLNDLFMIYIYLYLTSFFYIYLYFLNIYLFYLIFEFFTGKFVRNLRKFKQKHTVTLDYCWSCHVFRAIMISSNSITKNLYCCYYFSPIWSQILL